MPLLGLLWCAAGAINTPSREGDEEERTQLGEDQIKQQESHISLKGVHVRRFNQNQNIRIGLQIIMSKLSYDIYDKVPGNSQGYCPCRSRLSCCEMLWLSKLVYKEANNNRKEMQLEK